MKKYAVGLLLAGLTSLGLAQDPEPIVREVALEGVTLVSPNASYLASVQDRATPENVLKLERKAASYNLKESPIYNKIDKAYEVFFSNSKGKIVATYNDDGKIITSYEKFSDVILPPYVRNTVHSAYPGWTMNSNTYLVSYYKNKGVKKIYHFKIEKDGETKSLKMKMKAMR